MFPKRLRRNRGARIVRPKILVAALLIGQALISALSPGHPFLVDVYLVHSLGNYFTASPASQIELDQFLLTESQFDRYERELLEDAKDLKSEKAFVVVRSSDGNLEQRDVRTFNQLIPEWVPSACRCFFDRRSIVRLDDYVDLWSQGNEIVASGHYHAFGEEPSNGDLVVARLSSRHEIVVANGLVPRVYVDGTFIHLGQNIAIPSDKEDEYAVMSSYTPHPDEADAKGSYFELRRPHILNLVAYLRGKYGIDPLNIEDVKKGAILLHEDFRKRYGGIFDDPRSPYNSENAFVFVKQQDNLLFWAKGGYLGTTESNSLLERAKEFSKSIEEYPGGYVAWVEDLRSGEFTRKLQAGELKEVAPALYERYKDTLEVTP